VKRGEWVAFPNADGFFYLGRNRDNAAASAGLQTGDPVTVHRFSGSSARSLRPRRPETGRQPRCPSAASRILRFRAE